jgi:hypothetical protein
MKIHPVVAELFHANAANSRFSQFYEGAQKLPVNILTQ